MTLKVNFSYYTGMTSFQEKNNKEIKVGVKERRSLIKGIIYMYA